MKKKKAVMLPEPPVLGCELLPVLGVTGRVPLGGLLGSEKLGVCDQVLPEPDESRGVDGCDDPQLEPEPEPDERDPDPEPEDR